MIPLETKISVWLFKLAQLLLYLILFVILRFSAQKRKGSISEEKIARISRWKGRGACFCFFPALLLLIVSLVLQNKGILLSAIPFSIVLLLGEAVYLANFIRLSLTDKK